MSVPRKAKILQAFDRATEYDAHAHIQKIVAERLAEQIAATDFADDRPALEIGCGTGFLTGALLNHKPMLPLTATDIAPAMIERAKAALGARPNLRFAIMDGENPDPASSGGYGLIASSLAFQWFEDLGGSVAQLTTLLSPQGVLAFTTLASGTFAEWKSAQDDAGMPVATRDYPSRDMLETICPPGFEMRCALYPLVARHEDGLSFLRALRAIGANTPWATMGSRTPGQLRSAITTLETAHPSGDIPATYEVAQILIRRK